MTGAIVLAVVAGLPGFITALWVQRKQTRAARELEELRVDQQNRRDEADRNEERRRDGEVRRREEEERHRTVKGRLDAFREPLLRSADDLRDRVVNIRQWSFLGYLSHPDQWRQRLALLGTLYRFGRYWATVEALYREVNPLRFETSEETKAVADSLSTVMRTFASDEYGLELMVWRDEQQAIGELMLREASDGHVPVMSFAAFVECYSKQFEIWFEGLQRGLTTPGVEGSQRLADLQEVLAELIKRLQAGRGVAVWAPIADDLTSGSGQPAGR